MSASAASENSKAKGAKLLKEEGLPQRLLLAAMGMEAEFTLSVDGRQRRPEEMFGDPRAFLGPQVMHRTGTSYHLSNGGAVYFDTGVVEVATPAIEIERGCAARAGRSLWEGIIEIRTALDRWERVNAHELALVGFSAHYNISFDLDAAQQRSGRSVDRLAYLLVHLLPLPVALLATNRRSTGVGVRPREDRIEITVDFTPSPALMIATATFLVGVVRAVMEWPSFDLDELDRADVPRLSSFRPIPHTSRKGWLAHETSFPESPFTADPDSIRWELTDGSRASLRQIAWRTARVFWHPIRRVSDPFSFRLISSVMRGRAPSLLDLPDRPPEYEDVGRLCSWENLFPENALTRSRYERVLIRAIAGRPLRIGGQWYRPVGMRGWSAVVFAPESGPGGRTTVPIDLLIARLDRW